MTRAHARLTKRGRIYTDPVSGHEYLSVTSTISAGLGKDFLSKWNAEMAAECLVTEWDKVSALYAADPASAQAYVAAAASRYSNRRADIGTAAHSYMEHHFKGLPLPADDSFEFDRGRKLDTAGFDEARMIWSQLKALIERIKLRPVAIEPLIVNRTMGDAGSADLVAESSEWEGVRVVDLKTKPRPKFPGDEVRIQVCVYSRGEVVLNEDGTETSMRDWPMDFGTGAALVASPVNASLFDLDLIGQYSVYEGMKRVAAWQETAKKGITPVQLIATETPEEVSAEIAAATSYAELQALYFRHAARSKWLAQHTDEAAQRKRELAA